MTDGFGPESAGFKFAVCKECGKSFRCEMVYALRRGGKKAAMQKSFWCSRECSRNYNIRVRRK